MAMLHEQVPNIHKGSDWNTFCQQKRAENVISENATTKAKGKIDGRMRGQIISDIMSAVKTIAPKNPCDPDLPKSLAY